MLFDWPETKVQHAGIAFCICILFGTFIAFLYNIGREPLQDYDEANIEKMM